MQYACAVRLCSTRRKILEDVKSHNWELRSPRDRHFSPWNPRRSQKMSRSVRSVIGCPWRKAYTTSNVSIAFHVVEYRLIQKWQAGCSVAGRWRSVLDRRRRHVMLHLLIAKVSLRSHGFSCSCLSQSCQLKTKNTRLSDTDWAISSSHFWI